MWTHGPAGSSFFPGARFGSYQLVSKVGEGGMGAVYLAVRADDQFERKVAIKVAPLAIEREDVMLRFRLERQTLALLDHPHIIKLLDGGASDQGVPYLVMDHVEGVTLDQYCADNSLDLRARLVLFRKICAAVHYAHQHLVIHRDLKPGNILVTGDGEPKLLDFGIAKLLDAAGEGRFHLTQEGATPMTLRYASPEQIRGKAVSVASDQYSLAVLLYELLAGRLPHWRDGITSDAYMWAILSEEPARPSAKAEEAAERPLQTRLLEGDLDAILLKALRKEPVERYQSVEHFSDDIQRHLEGRPVQAQQGTWRYRTQKFVLRNKVAVALSAIFGVALVIAMGGMAWQWRVARTERARADARFQDVHQLARSFLFDFERALDQVPGSTAARVLLIRNTSEYLERLNRDVTSDIGVLLDIGEAYLKLGSLQGSNFVSSVGDLAAAELSFGKAVAAEQKVLRLDPTHRQALDISARAYLSLTDVFSSQGRMREAAASTRQAVDVFTGIVSRDSKDIRALRDAGVALSYLAAITGLPGQLSLYDRKKALGYAQQATAGYERLLQTDPKSGVRANLDLARMQMACLLAAEGAVGQAVQIATSLEPWIERLPPAQGVDFAEPLALVWQIAGDHGKALRLLDSTAEYRKAQSAADSKDTGAQFMLASHLYNQGVSRAALGNKFEALASFDGSLRILHRLVGFDKTNLLWRFTLAQALHDTAVLRKDAALERSARVLAKELAERRETTPGEVLLYAAIVRADPGVPGDGPLAIAQASRAVEMAPSAWEAHDGFAQACAAGGDMQRALEAEGKALALLDAYGTDAKFPARDQIRQRLEQYRKTVRR